MYFGIIKEEVEVELFYRYLRYFGYVLNLGIRAVFKSPPPRPTGDNDPFTRFAITIKDTAY